MSRPARSLRSILAGAAAAIFLSFLTVFLLVSAAGFTFARLQWQREAGNQVRTVLGTRLDSLVASGRLQGEAVSKQVSNLLGPSVFLLVFGPEGELVYWSWKGHSWYREDNPDEARRSLAAEIALLSSLPPEDHPVFQEGLYGRLKEQGQLVELWSKGVKVGAYTAGKHPFEVSEDNRQLLVNLGLALLVGLLAATTAGWAVGWRRLRPSVDRAAEVAGGLAALSRGNRGVTFRAGGPAELETIAASALTLQETLVREQELRRRWAQDIAHDLKTPLAGLRIQLEALADGVLPPTPERLQTLMKDLGQLDGLTLGLLELGRLESPELELRARPLKLRDLLLSLREGIEPLRFASGRDLEWTETGGVVLADPDLLRRALSNLLANAFHHASGAGAVRFRCASADGVFTAEVRNPGRLPGAGRLPVARLFRGDPSRTGGGHGLGLSIAQRIAELHGGSLEVLPDPPDLVVARLSIPSGGS